MELVDDITEKLTNEFLIPNVEQVRPRVKKIYIYLSIMW